MLDCLVVTCLVFSCYCVVWLVVCLFVIGLLFCLGFWLKVFGLCGITVWVSYAGC